MFTHKKVQEVLLNATESCHLDFGYEFILEFPLYYFSVTVIINDAKASS